MREGGVIAVHNNRPTLHFHRRTSDVYSHGVDHWQVSSRQGHAVPFTPIRGPDAWIAADYRSNEDYIYRLTSSEVQELDGAVAAAKATGKDIMEIVEEDFPLPNLGMKLKKLLEEVQWGRGFQLIRGVPVDRYTREESMLAYWGLGLYWGPAKSNNKKGHLIGHIKDIGLDPSAAHTRLFATRAAQPFHNDSAGGKGSKMLLLFTDVVALLCLRNAREGGLSSWSSSISVYNKILKQRPDLAKLLAGPWFFDRKGEIPLGQKPYFCIPVFNFHKGYLSVNFSDNYFKLSQRHSEVPRLTPAHHEAMELFASLAASDELRLDALLQPGDIQLLNNHVCLHARSAFVDHQDINEKRHMLRLWISPVNDRPLPDVYKDLLGGSVESGKRGGIIVDGTKLNIALEAE